jgi:hypothetical protein
MADHSDPDMREAESPLGAEYQAEAELRARQKARLEVWVFATILLFVGGAVVLAITSQPFLLVYVALVCVSGVLTINLESAFSAHLTAGGGKDTRE